MFHTFSIAFSAIISVLSIILLGTVLRRLGRIPAGTDTGLMCLAIDILFPCLIFKRIIQTDAFSDLQNLWLPPLIGFGMTALGILAGFIVSQLPSRMTGLNDAQTKRTFTACVGLLNYGYVPIPLIDALFPGDTHISGTLFTAFLGAEISLWTITLLTMQGNFDKASLYRIVNIPIITILVSVPLNILFLQSPDCKAFAAPVLDYLLNGQYGPVHLISSAAIPLALLMIGLSITELLETKPVAARFPVLLKIALCSCLVRLFILPALLIAAAVFLPCTLEIKRVMVVYAAMASAILPIALAKHYGGSTETAFDTCMSNTLVSLFTSPVWITAGLYFIGG